MIVERLHKGFQWADPLRKGSELEVELLGSELQVRGFFTNYKIEDHPSDLFKQHEIAAKFRAIKKLRTSEEPPEIRFANADTDEKLIAFVRRFGPVVAVKCSRTSVESEEEIVLINGLPVAAPRLLLTATQDMEELRNEQAIYRSALMLIRESFAPDFDFQAAQLLIGEIAAKITDWPQQWERERVQRKCQPMWGLSDASLQRIEHLKSAKLDKLLPPVVDARIVICELLNSFRAMVFPNPLEMHASIQYGIRPLLYSLLLRQFLYPREFSICANTHCKNFFSLERGGQKFCSEGCSRHQRQRDYWEARGKKLRNKRLQDQKKKKQKRRR